jgi:hypothetical protein
MRLWRTVRGTSCFLATLVMLGPPPSGPPPDSYSATAASRRERLGSDDQFVRREYLMGSEGTLSDKQTGEGDGGVLPEQIAAG